MRCRSAECLNPTIDILDALIDTFSGMLPACTFLSVLQAKQAETWEWKEVEPSSKNSQSYRTFGGQRCTVVAALLSLVLPKKNAS
jgi:hypothetical protein